MDKVGYEQIEQSAMAAARRNKPSPPTGDILDRWLYLALYGLYATFYEGKIARDTAAEIKRQLVSEYEKERKISDFRTEMHIATLKLWRESEAVARDYAQNRTIENADRLWSVIHGRLYEKGRLS